MTDPEPTLRIGYLIPEFPGQTHIWMWREIEWMQRWCDVVHVYSTRKPGERDMARHAFAAVSKPITTYLWPAPVLRSMCWAAAKHPGGLLSAVGLCFTLPIEKQPAPVHLLKLIPSACFLSKDASDRHLSHLHVHSCANGAILGMLAKRITGIGLSLTLNANIDWWGGAMSEKFRSADFTIAITEWLLAQMRRDFPELGQDQALLGRIGVDTRSWQPKVMEGERGARPFRVVTVARLHWSKGHDTLVSAMEQLVNDGRNVELRIVGDGPERVKLEQQVAAAGLNDRVSFAGSVSEDEVKRELLSSDAFALASHAEPLGVAYMEAMAAGVPTIGTNAGGVTEIITDGHDGLLIEPKNPTALARAIASVMDDGQLARQLSERGRATVVERFDSRIGASTLYTRITGQAPPAAS